jgi:hypothetical protein
MSKYNNEFSESESSIFNEAGFQINRLHNAWMNCKRYRTQGDLLSWRWELESIWSELYVDAIRASKDNEEDILLGMRTIDKLINRSAQTNNNTVLYNLLDKKEKRLRLLQDQAGKGGSYSEGQEGMD